MASKASTEDLLPVSSTTQSESTPILTPAESTTNSSTSTPQSQAQQDQASQPDVVQPPPHILRQQSRLSTLSAQLAQLTDEVAQARTLLQNPDADATIARHIKLLHEYNGVRDAGLRLMDIVAERRGVRVAEVMAEFGVGEGD